MKNDSLSEDILNNPGILQFIANENEDNGFTHKIKNKIPQKDIISITSTIQDIFKNMFHKLLSSGVTVTDLIQTRLKNFYNSNKFDFPGMQVVSLGTKLLQDLSRKDPRNVLICEKSDGVRYLLLHFTNDKVFLFNRKMEFFDIELDIKLPKSNNGINIRPYDIENLLDGELVLDEIGGEKKMRLIIFDSLVIVGNIIGHLPFHKRIEQTHLFFKNLDNLKGIKNVKNSFYNRYQSNIDNVKIHEVCHPFKYGKNINNKRIIELFNKDYFFLDKISILYNSIAKRLPHENA